MVKNSLLHFSSHSPVVLNLLVPGGKKGLEEGNERYGANLQAGSNSTP